MPATSQYHVVLDGQGYLIDLASYKKAVNEPFAPKRRSGDPGYGDLALASVWAQESWKLGMGIKRWTPPSGAAPGAGYDVGYGLDPHFGDLRMGRSMSSVLNQSGRNDFAELLIYNGKLFLTQGDGQRIFSSTDGSTYSTELDSGEPALRNMAVFNGWLIVASNSSGKLFKYDGTTWTSPWITLTAAEVQGMAVYQIANAEYLFCGCRQSASKTNNLTQVNSGGTAVVAATLRQPYIETMATFDGRLWISAYDDSGGHLNGTLYTFGGSALTEVTRLPENVISAFCPFRGELYAGSRTRGKIWRVSARGLEEVFSFPDVAGIGGVSAYAMPIRTMAVDDDRLHVPILDVNGLGLYSYDGVGWANIAAGGLGQEPRFLAAFLSDLYITNKSSAGARVYRIERKSPTAATWVSSSFDAGLAATDKLFLKVDLYHAALNSGESVVVDYEKDGSGSWTNLGTSNTVGATAKSFAFASGTTAKAVRIRLTISLSTQTLTPKITGILTSFLVSPDVKAEWTFDCLLEGSAQTPLVRLDNSNEAKTGPQLADALWASRAKKQTLSFTDLDAETKTVHFADLEEKVAPAATQRLGHQTRGRVALVEA